MGKFNVNKILIFVFLIQLVGCVLKHGVELKYDQLPKHEEATTVKVHCISNGNQSTIEMARDDSVIVMVYAWINNHEKQWTESIVSFGYDVYIIDGSTSIMLNANSIIVNYRDKDGDYHQKSKSINSELKEIKERINCDYDKVYVDTTELH